MADPNRIHHIIVEWSYPTKLDNIDTHWKCNDNGLYYISRKFGEKESPIYIGETKRDFITRINEHYKSVSEFFDKRGEKYIRLANALCNKRQVLSYTEWFKLYIENIGFRGSLSRELPYIDE